MSSDSYDPSRRTPAHAVDGLGQQPSPQWKVEKIVWLHLSVGQDEYRLQVITPRNACALLPPIDGLSVDTQLRGQRIARSSRSGTPVRKPHANPYPIVRPFWLDWNRPFWQYANMVTENIFYIRRVANENQAPNRIEELRKAIGMTQKELSELAFCDQSTINKIEKGQRGLDQAWMRRIAPLLGVTPADLLPREDNPYILSDRERELVEQLRATDDRGRDTLHTIAAALGGRSNTDSETAA